MSLTCKAELSANHLEKSLLLKKGGVHDLASPLKKGGLRGISLGFKPSRSAHPRKTLS